MLGILLCMVFIFVGFGVLLLVHFCVGGGPLRWSFINQENVVQIRRRNANACNIRSNIDLEKLPCYEFKATEEGSGSSADCAVCLENFKVGDRCRLLPKCRHSFHSRCVDSWLLKTPSCPICRMSASWENSCMVSSVGSSADEIELREDREFTGENQLSSNASPLYNSPTEPGV